MNPFRNPHPSSGFSLVEVAVALLVVSVGMLAAFGLFPAGLQSGRASLDETRAIFFAEETFNSFRGLAASTNQTWATFEGETPAPYGIPALGNSLWHDPGNELPPRVTAGVRLNRYVSANDPARFVSAGSGLSEGIEEYALRYVLEVTDLGTGNMRKGFSLWVWPGEFGEPAPGVGPSDEQKNTAFFFYTEIFNTLEPVGDLAP